MGWRKEWRREWRVAYWIKGNLVKYEKLSLVFKSRIFQRNRHHSPNHISFEDQMENWNCGENVDHFG